ncbi:unnamed protein product [Menidia menidia]|uniref:(Atlantic silverside) hypothetical protein n=1 Tax=Menidia menidia TaxID=238744 RepID=A0A8S4BBA3_9TELE|nr:unnamed protein product [Menidia menidia]
METSDLEKRLSSLSRCSLASSASTYSWTTSVAGDDRSLSSSSSSQSDASYGSRRPFWAEPPARPQHLSHYQEQLELSHQKLQHVETLGDEEHIRRNQQKYDSLAEKTREMGYKMKKHMQDLSNKISRQGLQHNEL